MHEIIELDPSNLCYMQAEEAKTRSESLSFVYFVAPDRVGIQVLTNNKVFPANTKQAIEEGLESVKCFTKVLEYDTDFNLWYVELRELPVIPNDSMLESMLSKIVAAQVGNGKHG